MTDGSGHQCHQLVEAHRQLRDRDDAVVFMQEEIEKRDQQIAMLRSEVDRLTEAFEGLCATRAVRLARWFWTLKARARELPHRRPPAARQ